MLDIEVANVDALRMRAAGKGALSLALMDARNHTLRWVTAFEKALGGADLPLPLAVQGVPGVNPLRWTIGHLGWFQEFWIARNMQRERGEHCDATLPRLASILTDADLFFDPASTPATRRWQLTLPALQTVRQYLFDTLETTLELLDGTPDTDDALYFYRLALFREDCHGEALAVLAQEVGFDSGLLPKLTAPVASPPLYFPATRWQLGMPHGGFVFDNEKWAHEVSIPPFEIDAQPVSWAQYCEFVEDGGYDNPSHWSAMGWSWVQAQAQARRTPRHVDQMRQGVLQRRFGRLDRVPMTQPAVHVSWFEADAWCRWAGRRLPAEVEWEAAAHQGATRGFRWGDVWEWTASTLRPYPGFEAGPTRDFSIPAVGTHKVLRGASFATRGRLRSAKFRNFEVPGYDHGFVGFRSCPP